MYPSPETGKKLSSLGVLSRPRYWLRRVIAAANRRGDKYISFTCEHPRAGFWQRNGENYLSLDRPYPTRFGILERDGASFLSLARAISSNQQPPVCRWHFSPWNDLTPTARTVFWYTYFHAGISCRSNRFTRLRGFERGYVRAIINANNERWSG